MAPTTTLNERAMRLADHVASTAAALRVYTTQLGNGARVIDCGIKTPGGLQAGLSLARVCLAGQAEVSLAPGDIAGVSCPSVVVATDQPILACMASQYAGWQISVGKFFAMGSGPMRAAYAKEELFNHIPGKETSPVAVGVLETRKMPDDAVAEHIATALGLSPRRMIATRMVRSGPVARASGYTIDRSPPLR